MLRRIMPSPAMAVALVALFVALGSGAYAQVSANSVGTPQLRNGAVTHPKLAQNSVWHANIGRHSVRNINLAHNSVWHAQLGGGVVRRNNMSAPLLSELGPARTVFGHITPPGAMPPNQVTQFQPSFQINTTGFENTLTVQAVIDLHNIGTAASTVECFASLANHPGEFVAFITAGTPPAPNDTWSGQLTLLGQWTVSAGNHTVTLSCRPFQPPAGTAIIHASAQILLTAELRRFAAG